MPGYVNINGQTVLRNTYRKGNDHNQYVYLLRCTRCGYEYGANGSDIQRRRCPKPKFECAAGGGRPGL